MDTAIRIKNAVAAGAAAVGGTVIHLLGGWDVTLQVLIGFMAADYLTGLVVAGVFHNSGKTESGALESRAGFKGLARKCAVLGLVFLAAMLDNAAGQGFIRPAVCLFFIANEGISVLENVGLMGVPYPAFLRDMLEALKKQGDQGEKGEQNGSH